MRKFYFLAKNLCKLWQPCVTLTDAQAIAVCQINFSIVSLAKHNFEGLYSEKFKFNKLNKSGFAL